MRTFEEINQDGCRTYEHLWLVVNEAAVVAAMKCRMPYSDPKEKVKIVSIVMAVMDALNKKGVIRLPTHGEKDFIMKSPTLAEPTKVGDEVERRPQG